MKWILLSSLLASRSIVFYAGTFRMEKKLLYPDNHIASLNVLLKEEFIKRVPNLRPWRFENFLRLAPWHSTDPSCWMLSSGPLDRNTRSSRSF